MTKRTMTLNLTDAEMRALERLCEKKNINKTHLLRQALRLYEQVEERLDSGGKLFFEDEATREKSEIMML